MVNSYQIVRVPYFRYLTADKTLFSISFINYHFLVIRLFPIKEDFEDCLKYTRQGHHHPTNSQSMLLKPISFTVYMG